MAKKDLKIRNSEGDFFQVQNYVLQLLSEKRISQSAFVLYSFYRSLAGFSEIKCGYSYISLNSGLSKGSISNSNKQLEKEGLIEITNSGPNNPFEIDIIPGASLPRRQLKKVDHSAKNNMKITSSESEQVVQQMNAEEVQSSADERINTSIKYSNNKNNTTERANARDSIPKEYKEFINEFLEYWSSRYNAEYRKQDLQSILEIPKKDISSARSYIPVLWSLDEADKWILKSDHSISVFVKEYKSGRLQTYYPQTIHYYKDKQKEAP